MSTWIGAAVIARLPSEAGRRLVLVYALALSGGVLLVFKYYAFFLGSIDDAGLQAQLSFGLDVGLGGVELLVPVGLSFYTFQSISYLVDVYRRELKPCRSLLDYALYVAFFPHLLAGPILRARRLLPKIQDLPRRPSPVQTAEGLEPSCWASSRRWRWPIRWCGAASPPRTSPAPRTDRPVPPAVRPLPLLLAIVGGFFDISGYIDLARGSAKLLGIDMQHNMAEPLTRSRNLTELYRRWQITIMSWFRDYVFLPLRGRGHAGELRESAALFGTFLAVAVWHGITVGWLMFGLLTGGLMVAERTLRTRRVARQRAETAAACREARPGGAKVAGGAAPHRPAGRLPPWLRAAVGIAYVYAALVATHVWVVVGDLGTGFRIYSWALGLGPGGIGSFDLEALVVLLPTASPCWCSPTVGSGS